MDTSKEINAQWQKGKTVAGISRHKLDVLDAYMHAANVQGVNSCDRRSISLLFRRCGYTKSVYEIYRSKEIAITDSYRQSNSHILFNDTIAFLCITEYIQAIVDSQITNNSLTKCVNKNA